VAEREAAEEAPTVEDEEYNYSLKVQQAKKKIINYEFKDTVSTHKNCAIT
jgi:hypothetical protein